MAHCAIRLPTSLPGVELIDICSDRNFPRHSHEHYGVGLMLTGGHNSWSCRGDVEAGPGHVISVNPDEIHDGRTISNGTRHWRMIYVDPTVLAHLSSGELSGCELPAPITADPLHAQAVTEAIHTAAFGCKRQTEETLVGLFSLLIAGQKHQSDRKTCSPAVTCMIERICNCPEDAPSLKELSQLSGLSPVTALRRFSRETGITPYAFLMQFRVRQARSAIADGVSLADAACQAGFADQSHMTRAFTRQFGISPGKWRASQFPSRRDEVTRRTVYGIKNGI